MRCDFHQFETCGMCEQLLDRDPGRTLYPGDRTLTDLVAIEREFPNSLTVLDWMAPSWYREHDESRLIHYTAIGSPTVQLMAIAGRKSMRWIPAAQVWVSCTRSVSSRTPMVIVRGQVGRGRGRRRLDGYGEVRVAIALEGPLRPGEDPEFKIVNLRPLDEKLYKTEFDASMIRAGVISPSEVRESRFGGETQTANQKRGTMIHKALAAMNGDTFTP